MLVSFVATLAPAVLDIVVQVSNSVAVNKISQGDKSIINNFRVSWIFKIFKTDYRWWAAISPTSAPHRGTKCNNNHHHNNDNYHNNYNNYHNYHNHNYNDSW